jgi:Holliday junction resolvasome RuvABC endonuclease subunit
MNKGRVVIGIDQSYKNTGLTIAINGEVFVVYSLKLETLPNNSEKRKELKEWLTPIVKELLKSYQPINIICIIERIRLQSKGFLSMDYIKSMGALNSVIVDIMYRYHINTFSVDTRAWKSAVVGTSKPQENKYGIAPEKYPTILWNVKNGRKKYIVDYCVGKKTKGVITKGDKKYMYDDDKSDSIGIALYGFLPKKLQKLEQEH